MEPAQKWDCLACLNHISESTYKLGGKCGGQPCTKKHVKMAKTIGSIAETSFVCAKNQRRVHHKDHFQMWTSTTNPNSNKEHRTKPKTRTVRPRKRNLATDVHKLKKESTDTRVEAWDAENLFARSRHFVIDSGTSMHMSATEDANSRCNTLQNASFLALHIVHLPNMDVSDLLPFLFHCSVRIFSKCSSLGALEQVYAPNFNE